MEPRLDGAFSCLLVPVINITATLDPHQHPTALSLRSLGHRRNTTRSPPTRKPMAVTNSQTTELSLDQLDPINGGKYFSPKRSCKVRVKAQAEGGMPLTTRSKDLLIGLV